jgi:GTP-binding protein EngB required for normal cell division
MKVSYTKEQRMRAQADSLALVTIDLPGFTFQGPVDRERAEQLDKFVMQWISERSPAEPQFLLQLLIPPSIGGGS